MPVTITAKGSDFKIDEGNQINYYPIDDMRQRAVGTTIELYDNGELVRSFNESEFVSPSGTAEEISDAISQLSTIGGGSINYGAGVTVLVQDTTVEVVPENKERKALLIMNENGEDCWLGIGIDAVVDLGFKLKKKETFIINPDTLTTQAINAICKNGKQTNLTYQEAI